MSSHKIDIHVFKIKGGTHLFLEKVVPWGATRGGTIVKTSHEFMRVYMPVETLVPMIGKSFQVAVPGIDRKN